ncbi:MAG: iron ABC transporter permease [Eubacteriales bacterium]
MKKQLNLDYEQRLQRKGIIFTIGTVLVLIVFGMIAMGLGRYSISVVEILATVFPKLIPGIEVTDTMSTVIFNIRLPRVLLACLAGSGLAVAGTAFQGIFSNALATPDTLGVASGAAFGAAFGLLLGVNIFLVQLFALVFGIISMLIVLYVSRINGTSTLIMIILAGMVVGALFQAMVSLVKYVADPQDTLPSITYWLMGSLSGTTYETLAMGAPFIIVGIVMIFIFRWKLNAMSLHEDEAKSLGVNVKFVRIVMIVASTMITAAVVSMCGSIGWIGLLIPHISRMIFGNNNRYVVPASIGFGAIYMLIIDTMARCMTEAEVPVSILTAVIGAPFFIILLRKTGGIKG